MKKVVRTIWISLLSGLAFLAACTSNKNRSNQEGIDRMNKDSIGQLANERKIQPQKDSIYTIIQRNSIRPCVYGPSPEAIFEQNVHKINSLYQQLDSIHDIILICRREASSIFDSPEVMEQYRNEIDRLENEASEIRKQIIDLEKEL